MVLIERESTGPVAHVRRSLHLVTPSEASSS
jgi:hypothetical protein